MWMTKRTLKLIKHKRKAYLKYRDNKNLACIQANKKAVRKVKVTKRNFEELLAQNIKEDSKSFYAYVRSKGKSNTKPGPLVDTHGQVMDADEKAAKEFNSYFVSVFTTEDIANVPESDEIRTLFTKLDSVIIDESDIKAALNRLRVEVGWS